jgi:hypothetical protein
MPMLAEDFATSQIEFLNQQKLPVVIRPMAGESLPEYFSAAGGSIVETLRQHGAILFRGFSLRTADEFQAACACLFKNELHSYIGGISPRRELLPGVFESTQLPAHLHMPQHNEMSYLPAPPRTIVFFCEVEPTEGGETPLAGSRAILEAIPVALRKKFERYGVRYHRQMYGPRRNALYAALNRWLKVRRSWMETFSTTDRAEVERICAMQGGTPHWDHEEGLSVTTNLPPRAAILRQASRSGSITSPRSWYRRDPWADGATGCIASPTSIRSSARPTPRSETAIPSPPIN